MRVGQLARKLGITPETVRFYTRIGYLNPSVDKSNGYKNYKEPEVQRMLFIIAARQLGFSVDDIGLVIREAESNNAACPLTRKLIRQRLEETEAIFARTQALRGRMIKAMKEWDSMPDKIPTGHEICHLIESFYDEGKH